jgi:hypothetical protein
MYRMLMIGLGAALITFGFVGIALSNHVETQKRQDWALVCQRAGASVSSFTVNLSVGDYYLGVLVWVHNYTDGFYAISDSNRNQIVVLNLATTDQSNELKLSDAYFQIIDLGYYTFELFNATYSSAHSTAKLYHQTYVDAYLYSYRSLFWVGVFSLVIGAPVVVVGSAAPLIQNPRRENMRAHEKSN